MPTYTPTEQFDHVNGLYGNHFRFVIDALPDVSFFVQAVTLPGVSVPVADRATPFTKIPEVGDHLAYDPLTVTYTIDRGMQSYRSLLWWLQGYGFPQSYDEVAAFRAARLAVVPFGRPSARELEKTNAVLSVLQPDTDEILTEFQFIDLFPTGIGSLDFSTTDGDVVALKTTATFAYTEFHIIDR
jgi:hypothetical protein